MGVMEKSLKTYHCLLNYLLYGRDGEVFEEIPLFIKLTFSMGVMEKSLKTYHCLLNYLLYGCDGEVFEEIPLFIKLPSLWAGWRSR